MDELQTRGPHEASVQQSTRRPWDTSSSLAPLLHVADKQENPQPFACRLARQKAALPLWPLAACAVVLGLRVGQETGA